MLVIAGPDFRGYQATVQAMIDAHGVGSSVLLAGMVQGEKKSSLLKRADVFVLPSYSENFGIVVAEVLACGTPVVTYHGHAVGAVACRGRGTVGVPTKHEDRPGSSASCWTCPSRGAGIWPRGAALIREQYTWDQAARKFLTVCDCVLKGRSIPLHPEPMGRRGRRGIVRVCYLLPRLHLGGPGVVVGGCAANCASVAMELKRQGVRDRAADIAVEQGPRPVWPGIRWPRLSGRFPRRGLGLTAKGIWRHLGPASCAGGTAHGSGRLDVVHSHSGTYPYAVIPLAARSRQLRPPPLALLPSRGPAAACTAGGGSGRPLVRMLFPRPLDRIVAVTDNIRQSIEKAGARR